MAVSEQQMQKWCETILAGHSAAPDLTLADYIRSIPGMATLADVPSGTPGLVRGDVDAKPGANLGDGDIRLRSLVAVGLGALWSGTALAQLTKL